MIQEKLVGIGDIHQIKRMARHGDTCLATIFGLDDPTQAISSHSSSSDLQQCPNNSPHHITQEAVGRDRKDPHIALFFPMGLLDTAVVGLHVGMQLAEAGVKLVKSRYSNRMGQAAFIASKSRCPGYR